jgi:hypothetical protein
MHKIEANIHAIDWARIVVGIRGVNVFVIIQAITDVNPLGIWADYLC